MGALGACEPTGPATWLCWIQGIPLHQEMVREQLDYEHKTLQESLHVPKGHQHHSRYPLALGDSWDEQQQLHRLAWKNFSHAFGHACMSQCLCLLCQLSKVTHSYALWLKVGLGFFLLPALFHWGQSSEFSLEEETSEHDLSLKPLCHFGEGSHCQELRSTSSWMVLSEGNVFPMSH